MNKIWRLIFATFKAMVGIAFFYRGLFHDDNFEKFMNIVCGILFFVFGMSYVIRYSIIIYKSKKKPI